MEATMWLLALMPSTAVADVTPCSGCGREDHGPPDLSTGDDDESGETGTSASLQRGGAGASAALGASVLLVGIRRRRARR